MHKKTGVKAGFFIAGKNLCTIFEKTSYKEINI